MTDDEPVYILCKDMFCDDRFELDSVLSYLNKKLDTYPTQDKIQHDLVLIEEKHKNKIHEFEVEHIEKKMKKYKEYMKKFFASDMIDRVSIPEVVIDSRYDGFSYSDGVFYIPSNQHMIFPILETTVCLHEGIPGHHMMYELLGKQFLRASNRSPSDMLIEGWGFYVERFYKPSLRNQVGYQLSKIIRLVRAIADIRFHHQDPKIKFNEQECLDFFEKHWPLTGSYTEEVERIKENPGFNVIYVIGEMFIEVLYLDTKYLLNNDIKLFHSLLFEVFDECKNKCELNRVHKKMLQKVNDYHQ